MTASAYTLHLRCWFGGLLRRWGYAAITVGSHIYVAGPAVTVRELRHELAHVAQWRRDGWLGFPVRYLWRTLRYGYRDNPYEVEARAAEGGAP